ncbi:hypothetical protein QQ045_029194 [Rhodiola kirilowii]
MAGRREDVNLGANRYREHQDLGTTAQSEDKDYREPPPAPLFDKGELSSWSFYRVGITEFIATFLFLYITVLAVAGVSRWAYKSRSYIGAVDCEEAVFDEGIVVHGNAMSGFFPKEGLKEV